MGERVCPWWLGYFLACPLRRLWNDPVKLLASYVREGMTVLEPGPGMGFFTLDLARLVGPSGRVIAVDVQPKMLERLKRRAAKAGLADRVDARLAQPESMGLTDLDGEVDFTLAFAVVHEFPSPENFFQQVARASRPGAQVLVAEPAGHVKEDKFNTEIEAALAAGFQLESEPRISRYHTALLKKL